MPDRTAPLFSRAAAPLPAGQDGAAGSGEATGVALSVRQPWAWAFFNPGPDGRPKDVVNRTWATARRGPVFIHAAKTLDMDGVRWLEARGWRLPAGYVTGGIVGAARIVDCVRRHDSPYFFGPFGFVLADARAVPFRPMRGKLGFFAVAGVAWPEGWA